MALALRHWTLAFLFDDDYYLFSQPARGYSVQKNSDYFSQCSCNRDGNNDCRLANRCLARWSRAFGAVARARPLCNLFWWDRWAGVHVSFLVDSAWRHGKKASALSMICLVQNVSSDDAPERWLGRLRNDE
jgi:hypothetical protein